MSLVNQFIENLMSQHVIPFWITLGIVFLIVVEIIYFKIIKSEKYSGSLGAFAVGNKIYSIFLTVSIFTIVYGIALFIEIISSIITVLLIVIGIVALVVGYFYINYLFAKKHAKKRTHEHKFKKGDKLKLIDEFEGEGLYDRENTLTKKYTYEFVGNEKEDLIRVKSIDPRSKWFKETGMTRETYFKKVKK